MSNNLQFVHASSTEEVQNARQLFEEYASSLGFSLCFQNFDQELASLPGKYSPPSGRLLLAYSNNQLAGCIALRQLDPKRCEMKRLFVRPEFRGEGLGRVLIDTILGQARALGYQSMLRDTIPGKMDKAIALYETIGFKDIEPYYNNPVEGARFMALEL